MSPVLAKYSVFSELEIVLYLPMFSLTYILERCEQLESCPVDQMQTDVIYMESNTTVLQTTKTRLALCFMICWFF